MFNYIKKKFKLSEESINELLELEVDLEELFMDYEMILRQIDKYKSDCEIHAHYQILLSELEKEIKRFLSKHQKQN